MSYDVIIAGAGPAGSALGTTLAADGYRVMLADRATFPRSKPCAEYLSPKTLGYLDRLDITDRLTAHEPAILKGMRITPDGSAGFVGRFTLPGPDGAAPRAGMALPREVLDHEIALGAIRAGAEFAEGTLVESFENDGNTMRVTLRAGGSARQVDCRLLVGADGLHSRVAWRIGVARRGRLRRFAFVTHFVDVAAMGELGEMHVRPEAYVGLAPVGRGLTNISLVVDMARAPRITRPEDYFHTMIERFGEVRDRLATARRVSPVIPVGPFARRSRRAVADRVILVGDAADFYDPFTGEGIYAALRGADIATDVLRPGLAGDRLLTADLGDYDRRRRRAFRTKWIVERVIARVIATPRLFERVAGRLGSRQQLADLIVGVTGDSLPPSRILNPAFLFQLVW